jgi:hypothetical protein
MSTDTTSYTNSYTNSYTSSYTSSYTNSLDIMFFLTATYIYFNYLKPELTYEKLTNPEVYPQYLRQIYIAVAIYLLIIIVSQTYINVTFITNKCGGSLTENIGSSIFLTLTYWVLIFGVLVVILLMFPGFKSAFADIIGYFWVSSSANKIITELLISQSVQPKIDKDASLSPDEKEQMQRSADALLKIFGNSSLLINEISPKGFNTSWELLTPLMKDKYKQKTNEVNEIRDNFFKLVVSREDVGEAFWYIYTGLFITSWVKLQISQKKCSQSVTTMEENQAKFEEAQQKAREKQAKLESTVYTL